jgi:hypothetical protein
MKAIVVTDQAAETAGMKLMERPEPQAAINDVVVQIHATERCDRHRPDRGAALWRPDYRLRRRTRTKT